MTLFLVASRLFRRARVGHVPLLAAVAVAILLVGAWAFSLVEHIGYGTALYWAITTATTVGYGDVTPKTTAGRVVASVVMLSVIPIFGAIFALVASATVLTHLRRLLGMEANLPKGPYTVIYGDHHVVGRVSHELAASGDSVVIVAPAQPAGAADSAKLVQGDPTDETVVKQSEPERANRALVACQQDSQALIVAIALRTLAPDLEIYALTESAKVGAALEELGVHHTLSSTDLVGHTVAKSLETPLAGDLLLQLVDSSSYLMRERQVDGDLVSRRLSEARAVAGALVLGVVRGGSVDLGVDADPVLSAGDRLVELVTRPS